jgi:hypothetical protein
MTTFVPYQIFYTYIFYLENLMQGKAAFGGNQYKAIWKIIEKSKSALYGARPTRQPPPCPCHVTQQSHRRTALTPSAAALLATARAKPLPPRAPSSGHFFFFPATVWSSCCPCSPPHKVIGELSSSLAFSYLAPPP